MSSDPMRLGGVRCIAKQQETVSAGVGEKLSAVGESGSRRLFRHLQKSFGMSVAGCGSAGRSRGWAGLGAKLLHILVHYAGCASGFVPGQMVKNSGQTMF